jgi:hypothetical protein
LADGEKNQSREGFAFTALVFGIVGLVTWRWTQVGTLAAMMSVGFGIVGLRSTLKLVAAIGIILGIVGLVLSLTKAFLQWP